jgi:hypothetical protein
LLPKLIIRDSTKELVKWFQLLVAQM